MKLLIMDGGGGAGEVRVGVANSRLLPAIFNPARVSAHAQYPP